MSQEKLDHVVAGAIFDFMGWLTTRQEKLVLSSADDAAPAAEAVKEFLTMRGVAQDCEPMIHDWPARCSMVTANNIMAAHGDPDYLKPNGMSVRHIDLRSSRPRKKKEPTP